MERREEALREALKNNAEETDRWGKYRKDNEVAVENLGMFAKRLMVDVMVPIGKKAYMPGQLVHTNEVLVGHYQGYFSKCSSHKAIEICQLRIETAQKHLEKLATEEELWMNKLVKPYEEGAIANADDFEIIEEYDEEAERLWREQHKVRVREAKLNERREKEQIISDDNRERSAEKSEEELLKILAESEIMEELEKELDSLELDEINDDIIRRLMSGEMTLPPEKSRKAHNALENDESQSDPIKGVVKRNTLTIAGNERPQTNNNYRPNPDIIPIVLDTEETPEVQLIKDQAQYLNDTDRIGFYEYQIEIVQKKLLGSPVRNQTEIDERIRLHQVLDELEELLELAEEAVGAEELLAKEEEEEQEKDDDNDERTENAKSGKERLRKKRRISFASENQTLEFRRNEAVTQMLSKASEVHTKNVPKKDVIRLDEDIAPVQETYTELDRKQVILSRVAKNVAYVEEHQSVQDCDLINKILAPSTGGVHTLHIQFKHSASTEPSKEEPTESGEAEVPATPADFYRLYEKVRQERQEINDATIFLNSYRGEESVRVPVLREEERTHAYADPRSEFSKPNIAAKSILRNKTAVSAEAHNVSKKIGSGNNKKKKQVATPVDEDEYMSAFNKVMHDVVEKPLTAPEPLPEERYIDAHVPKKRISRFKQMRAVAQKT